MRLHIDGEIAGEKALASSLNEHSDLLDLKKINSVNIKGYNAVQGYVHRIEVLSPSASIKDVYVKVYANCYLLVFGS